MSSLHIKTQKNKELVTQLAFDGISKTRIAEYLGISLTTFNQHYKMEYIRGNVDAERECQQVIRERMLEDKNLTGAIVRAKFLGAVEAKHKDEEQEKPQIVEHRIVRVTHENYKDIEQGIVIDQEKDLVSSNIEHTEE